MATVIDVAKEAGVSPATVSRVMCGNPTVDPELATKVRDAAEKLGYLRKKDLIGPRSRKRTGNVGLLALGVRQELVRLPYSMHLVADLENALEEKHFQLVVSFTPEERVLPQLVSPERLDGLIVTGRPHPELRPAIAKMNVVLVYAAAWQHGDGPWADWVTPDYTEIGRIAGDHLLRRGHKSIAFINVDPGLTGLEEVGCGFASVCAGAGASPITMTTPGTMDAPIWDPASGADAAKKLIGDLLDMPQENRPTGVLVSECAVAGMLYDMMRERNLEPGKDMEVVTRDCDEGILASLSPRPAAVHTNHTLVAQQAVEILLRRMACPDGPAGTRTLIPPRIMGNG